MIPDMDTAIMDPFTEHKTLRVLAHICDSETRVGVAKDPRSLARPIIWAGGTLHLLVTVAAMTAICGFFDWVAFTHFEGLDLPGALLLGFALSFSSTKLP